jgi:GST-like protein
MSEIALAHGATIDKYAIVIFFGDPESAGVKQDALRCARMVLAMQRRMADLREMWRDAGIAQPLRCRMGINTGFCTVGNFGSENRMDYTIIGSGVNLASRLESVAGADEILISYETHALIRDAFLCEERGPVEVRPTRWLANGRRRPTGGTSGCTWTSTGCRRPSGRRRRCCARRWSGWRAERLAAGRVPWSLWGANGSGAMIELYTWTTPNGRKASILLEELGVHYEVHAVDINAGEQFRPEYLAVAPSGQIPAIVDTETGVRLMESAAVMLYLAEKYRRFLPTGNARWEAVEWLAWQVGFVGPMLGQVHHFVKFHPGVSGYAEERYSKAARRAYETLDRRLEGRDFVAGAGRGEYSVADMAIWPWISRFEWQKMPLKEFGNLCRWYLSIAARPAVDRGYKVPKLVSEIPLP